METTNRSSPYATLITHKPSFPFTPSAINMVEERSDMGDTSSGAGERSCEEQFAASLQHTLEKSGELHKLKASIRSTIMNVIRGHDSAPINRVKQRSPAISICNDLVVDFLHWSGYQYSMEMFATESGAKPAKPEATDRRMELARQLEGGDQRELSNPDQDVPVLLAMVVERMHLGDELKETK